MIHRLDDALIGLNLLLLLGVTWVPFPTALLAEHLRGPDQRMAALVYSATFLVIAVVFNVLWQYAIRKGLVLEHLNVGLISRQYSLGPLCYVITMAVATVSATACLVVSTGLAIYFALPPRLWQRR